MISLYSTTRPITDSLLFVHCKMHESGTIPYSSQRLHLSTVNVRYSIPVHFLEISVRTLIKENMDQLLTLMQDGLHSSSFGQSCWIEAVAG
jgi:hypothetical protein